MGGNGTSMPGDGRWLLPEGIEELLPAEARTVERMRRELLDLCDRWGYELVIPPLVEFTESLLIGLGPDLDLQTFKLTDHPQSDCNRTYLTTGIDLSIDPLSDEETATRRPGEAGQFKHVCRVEAIPSDVSFRPARTAPQPRIAGVQTAVVVGPSGQDVATPYTNAQGSLRLQFRWDRYGQSDDKSSAWVRCSQFWAGPSWGAVFLPRLGCEVAVAFEEGDPDRPLVIGSLYNGNNSPPLSLPSKAQNLIVKDDGGNYLEFAPADGTQLITVYSPQDKSTLQLGKTQN